MSYWKFARLGATFCARIKKDQMRYNRKGFGRSLIKQHRAQNQSRCFQSGRTFKGVEEWLTGCSMHRCMKQRDKWETALRKLCILLLDRLRCFLVGHIRSSYRLTQLPWFSLISYLPVSPSLSSAETHLISWPLGSVLFINLTDIMRKIWPPARRALLRRRVQRAEAEGVRCWGQNL